MKQYRTSLVITTLNEYGSLPTWIEGLRRQTTYPDECVIVDGGSTDGTIEYLQEAVLPFPFRLIVAQGANISTGRNIAIANSTGAILAVTDAGTFAMPTWFEQLTSPLQLDPGKDISAGFFTPDTPDWWTTTLAATTLPDRQEIAPDTFLPSSRSVAFRRRWIAAGFGYPEWLDYCEDLVFDLHLRRAGARQVTSLDAMVKFKPRSGPVSYIRQYFHYACGDGKAGLFALRHGIRYLTYGALVATLSRHRRRELVVAVLAGGVYLRRPLLRFSSRAVACPSLCWQFLLAAPTIAFQRLIGDLAKMAGYPCGLIWRLRRDLTPKFWKSGWQCRRPDGLL